MYVRKVLALSAALLGSACEVPVDTGTSNPDFGVVSVAIQPKTATVLVGDSLQLSASVLMSNNRPPNSVNWTTTNSGLATVSSGGVVRGRAAGGLFIRASSGSKRDSAAVTVVDPSPAPVASVSVAPGTVTVTVGGTVSLVATLKDANGTTLAGRAITWASSNAGVATVNGTGVVSAAAVGAATITATSEGQSGTATVSVTAVPVASVSVSPATASVQAGQTVHLTATPKDANGAALSGRTVTWASSNGGVATVSGGVVSGVAAGSVTITATSEGQSGSATVSVTAVPVASVSVSPATASVQAGQTLQLTATPKDASGSPLNGRAVTWTSSNGGVAAVSGTGLVTGVAAGSATITATSEGQSGSATVAVTVPASAPGMVGDLAVAATTDSSVTLRFTEVDGGTGAPASYDIRYATGSTLSWGANTTSVSRGTCATPVAGTAIGASRTCTVLGLGASTTYSFELVAFRGTLSVNAVFGSLSNVASGTTGAAPGGGGGGGGPGQVTYYRTSFTDGTTGPLDVYAYNGGSCTSSTDYVDPGSAHSIKCTIPANTSGAAALQAWFGNGGLANVPKDPSLDQDLFEEVRFVLAPGAANAIGGTSCNSSNPTSQFKVHKSVYGQVGSAKNGWVMSDIGPCSDGNIGIFSEPEMWTINGQAYAWPGTYPSLHEGTVYDVVYRYHRYTAQGCGTIAIWFNGTKVMDSPCWSYMGTTNGSAEGLLFWDGATYLQAGLTPLVVYNLFAQATNYPIGAGTASP